MSAAKEPAAQLEEPKFRECVRDMLALSNLATCWIGRDMPFIAESLLDIFVENLNLDAGYVRLQLASEGVAIELARHRDKKTFRDLRTILGPYLNKMWGEIFSVPDPDGDLRGIVYPIGQNGENGVILCAARHPGFPTPMHRVLIQLCLNQAAIALQNHQIIRIQTEAGELKETLLRQEKAERVNAETGQKRVETQKAVLVELAREASNPPDETSFLRRVTTACAATLNIERVSVWFFDDDKTSLRCRDLYLRTTDTHAAGQELAVSMFPAYFRALEKERMIAAHSAFTDPMTREFTESYLKPLDIRSMLDAPVRRQGRVVGVLCHEHVGDERIWTADEQSFAASLSDLISLSLEVMERKKTERILRESEESFKGILDSLPAALYVCDKDGRITFYNQRAVELWGRHPEPEDRFCGSLRLILPDGREVPPSGCPMAQVLSDGVEVHNVGVKIIHADGKIVPVVVNIRPLRHPSGTISGAINCFQYVS